MKNYKTERIQALKELIDAYGRNTTLEDALEKELNGRKYVCPECQGKGTVTKLIHGIYGYTDDEYVSYECDLCKGYGYTEREYKPKYEQVGWE